KDMRAGRKASKSPKLKATRTNNNPLSKLPASLNNWESVSSWRPDWAKPQNSGRKQQKKAVLSLSKSTHSASHQRQKRKIHMRFGTKPRPIQRPLFQSSIKWTL